MRFFLALVLLIGLDGQNPINVADILPVNAVISTPESGNPGGYLVGSGFSFVQWVHRSVGLDIND